MFASGAAVAASAVLIYALANLGIFSRKEPSVRAIASLENGSKRPVSVSMGNPFIEPGFVSTYTFPRPVSDRTLNMHRAAEVSEPQAFNFVSTAREDSLMRENEMLRRRVEYLQRRIIYLQATIENRRTSSDNFPLP